MFDKQKYLSIAPCFDDDNFDKAMDIVLKNKENVFTFFNNNKHIIQFFENLNQTYNWKEFQTLIFKYFMPCAFEIGFDSFTFAGLDNLDKEMNYVFISNHRDIVMDSMCLIYALLSKDYKFTQPILGSNLTAYPFLASCFVLSGGVVINRNAPVRDLYNQSYLLSSYIYDTIQSSFSSIWLAGEAGRSKNGIDCVKSSVIKMIFLSQSKKMLLEEFLQNVPIVPVTISYEYDPNVILKSYEYTIGADYKKRPLEDFISILKGIKGKKGRVHVEFSKVVPPTFSDVKDLVDYIQEAIRKNYKLYPINYYAYDILNNSQKFKYKYEGIEGVENLTKMIRHLSWEHAQNVLKYYSGCVL